MTTIAWDGRYLAADSMATMGNYTSPKAVQKIRQEGNTLYAIVGFSAWFDAWIAWHKAGADPKALPVTTIPAGCTGNFIVIKDGICRFCGHDLPYFSVANPPDAWGSGSEFAIGAMLAGCSAERAIEIAIQADPYSGGPVQVVDTYPL